MGPDGSLSYKPDYHSNGPQILVRPNGSQLRLSPFSCSDLQLLGGDKAIWREGNRVRVHGLPPCIQVGSIWKPRAVFVNDEWWVCYYSAQAGVVLHPFASTIGYRIVPAGQDAWHDAVHLGANLVRVTYSTGIAELPGEVFSVDVNLSSIRMELNVAPVVHIPAINRPLWLAFFEFAEGPPSPGNAMLAVRNISGEKRTRPVIVTSETAGSITGRILGHEVSGATVEEIEAKASQVDKAFLYWDDRNWPRWPVVTSKDVVCIQAYRWANESIEEYEADLVRIINSAPPDMWLALVPSCYTSNLKVHKDLASVVPVMAKLAREHHSIKAILPFSGYGRATGLQDHPELRPLWQSVADSITVPVKEPDQKPEPNPKEPVQMQPYNEDLVRQAEDVIIAEYARANRPPDAARGAVWIARMVYDYCAGMSWQASQNKHLVTLRQELGLSDGPSEVP